MSTSKVFYTEKVSEDVLSSQETQESLEEKEPDISDHFEDYAMFCDKNGSQGISLKNTYKWMGQSGVLGAKLQVTKADVKRCFYLVAGDKERISCDEMRIVIKTLAVDKLVGEHEISGRMIAAGKPRISGLADVCSVICGWCR